MAYDSRGIATVTARPTSGGVEVVEGSNVKINVKGPGVGRFIAGTVAVLYPPQTRRGGEIAQAFASVPFLISSIVGGEITGTLNPQDLDNPAQVEKGWLCDNTWQLPAGTIATTRAGMQAAWDSLPATGGALELPPSTTVVSDGTTVEFSGKDDCRLVWPPSFVLKAPANAVNYGPLIQLGDTASGSATFTLVDQSAPRGQGYIHFADVGTESVPIFTRGQMLLLQGNSSSLFLDRVSYVDYAAKKVWLEYPVAYTMTAGPGIGVYTVPNMTKRLRVEGRVTVDVGDNTHFGLRTGATFANATTLNGAVAQDATQIVVASATGYAALDFMLINGNLIRQIPTGGVAGTTFQVDVNFLATVANGASVQEIVGGLSDLRGSVGILLSLLEDCQIDDMYANGIVGSGIASQYIYQGSYKGRAYNCGFPYQPAGGAYAGAVQMYVDTAVKRDVVADNSQSWGVWGDFNTFIEGTYKGVGSVARNVKLASAAYFNDPLLIGIGGRYKTGVAISNLSYGGRLRAIAENNGGNGFWFDNTGNADIHATVYASKNNRLGLENGDVFIELNTTGSKVLVTNDDAVIVDQVHATRYLDSIFLGASVAQEAASGTAARTALTGNVANNYEKYETWAFDGAAIETIIFPMIKLPPDWVPSTPVTCIVHWSAIDGTAGNVVWRILASTIAAGDQADVGSEYVVDSPAAAAGGARDIETRSTVAAFSPDGPKLRIALARDPTAATDTLAVDAWFTGLEVQFYRKRVPAAV